MWAALATVPFSVFPFAQMPVCPRRIRADLEATSSKRFKMQSVRWSSAFNHLSPAGLEEHGRGLSLAIACGASTNGGPGGKHEQSG
ncbi:hypothetical protein BD779DRAFT_1536947 [Infundibulicybe gibba]|nr:hypothetical protein BD779DRAFT_1536947 [Infundibulicybe gibba]